MDVAPLISVHVILSGDDCHWYVSPSPAETPPNVKLKLVAGPATAGPTACPPAGGVAHVERERQIADFSQCAQPSISHLSAWHSMLALASGDAPLRPPPTNPQGIPSNQETYMSGQRTSCCDTSDDKTEENAARQETPEIAAEGRTGGTAAATGGPGREGLSQGERRASRTAGRTGEARARPTSAAGVGRAAAQAAGTQA